eukprot:766709-Hanusia_phi.AAC.2
MFSFVSEISSHASWTNQKHLKIIAAGCERWFFRFLSPPQPPRFLAPAPSLPRFLLSLCYPLLLPSSSFSFCPSYSSSTSSSVSLAAAAANQIALLYNAEWRMGWKHGNCCECLLQSNTPTG